MTTPLNTPAPDTLVETNINAAPSDEAKPAIPAFSFPFKPGELMQAKKEASYYQKSGKSNHEKRPGAAPSGTRRSMGKR